MISSNRRPAAYLAADQVFADATLTAVNDIGSVNLAGAGTYDITWKLFGSRSNNTEGQAQVDVTNVDSGKAAGKVFDQNGINRVEEGVVELNIQYQSNNEIQLIELSYSVVVTAASVATLQYALETGTSPHTIYSGSFVVVERVN